MKYNSEKFVGFWSGYLTVLSYNNGEFLCQCDCGRLITAKAWSIANYKKKSCSSRECTFYHKCLSEAKVSHGLTGSRLYTIWHNTGIINGLTAGKKIRFVNCWMLSAVVDGLNYAAENCWSFEGATPKENVLNCAGLVDGEWQKHNAVSDVTNKAWTPAVGDIVVYNGTTHYTSANASTAKSCKGGKAKITQIYQLGKSKHPYHLVRVSGSGATVYGWVDAGTFTKA